MKYKVLFLCFALSMIVLTPSYAKNTPQIKSSPSPASKVWFDDDWRASKGIIISFNKTGSIYIAKYEKGKKTILSKGKYKILFYSSSSDSPGDLIHVFVAEIIFGEVKAVVPACSFSGEGDPAAMTFYQLDNSFGYELQKYFDIKHDDFLTLHSTDVEGNWPEDYDK